jgi:hypothetical protein
MSAEQAVAVSQSLAEQKLRPHHSAHAIWVDATCRKPRRQGGLRTPDLRPPEGHFPRNCNHIATTRWLKTGNLQVFPLSGIRESKADLGVSPGENPSVFRL